MLLLNPEPLLFMTFPREENWPFPKYLGACGRLAVFEDAGKSSLGEAYFKTLARKSENFQTIARIKSQIDL